MDIYNQIIQAYIVANYTLLPKDPNWEDQNVAKSGWILLNSMP
jgi:hypothetical protein